MKYLGAPGFETYVLHLVLFLEEAHEGNCWIFDLGQPDGKSSIQYQVQLFCGGGNLLLVLETKSSHLTPYPSPDVLLDLGDSIGWSTLLRSLKRHIFFILDEISPESLTAFSTVGNIPN